MADDLAIYQLNAQSADKLDERRDATIRSHGGMSGAVAAAATGTFEALPALSAALWIFLAVIALSWLATLASLTAKLAAKNCLLTKMERDGLVPGRFLIRERKRWKRLGKPPLQKALSRAPGGFLVLGVGGFLATIGRFVWSLSCI